MRSTTIINKAVVVMSTRSPASSAFAPIAPILGSGWFVLVVCIALHTPGVASELPCSGVLVHIWGYI